MIRTESLKSKTHLDPQSAQYNGPVSHDKRVQAVEGPWFGNYTAHTLCFGILGYDVWSLEGPGSFQHPPMYLYPASRGL